MSSILKYNRNMDFNKYAPILIKNLKEKNVKVRPKREYDSNHCKCCGKDLNKKYSWDDTVVCFECEDILKMRSWKNTRMSNNWSKVEMILREVNGLYLNKEEQKDLIQIFVRAFGYKDKKNTNRLPTFNVINKILETEGHNYRFVKEFKQIDGKRIAWVTCLDVVFEENEERIVVVEEEIS